MQRRAALFAAIMLALAPAVSARAEAATTIGVSMALFDDNFLTSVR